ncbi:MAG TPA: hypothetical protein ENI23_08715 [bacterium]|nr:hypothetical protein [bacterium]
MPSLKSYSQVVSKGQSKPIQKFTYEILYGLLTGGSVRLSQIARTLKEDTILLYTEKRLSRNICGRIDTDKLEERYLKLVKVGEVSLSVRRSIILYIVMLSGLYMAVKQIMPSKPAFNRGKILLPKNPCKFGIHDIMETIDLLLILLILREANK